MRKIQALSAREHWEPKQEKLNQPSAKGTNNKQVAEIKLWWLNWGRFRNWNGDKSQYWDKVRWSDNVLQNEPWDITLTLHWVLGHPVGKHSTFTLQHTSSNMVVDKVWNTVSNYIVFILIICLHYLISLPVCQRFRAMFIKQNTGIHKDCWENSKKAPETKKPWHLAATLWYWPKCLTAGTTFIKFSVPFLDSFFQLCFSFEYYNAVTGHYIMYIPAS